ncbi:Cytosolic seryl-tRNA synthetase [Thelotrema lepadinum]|nr:Cytosolic seryl-tRNA synthetase [Thelotrema lepadinum]
MLDLLDFQEEKGGDLKKLRESQKRRYAPQPIIDDIVALFEDHKKTKYAATQIGSKINGKQKEIGQKKKAKEDAADLMKEKVDLEKEKKVLEDSAAEKEEILTRKLKTIGNYVHDSVPVSNDEENNAIVRTWKPEGSTVEKRDCLSHHEVLTRIDGYDPERGVKVVGHRGYCLTGIGLFLNLALVNYGLEFLWRKGYKPNQPPHLMLREQMAKTAQLEQFDEELYKVVESEEESQSEKFLIATSEQPISALHDGEWLQDADLPIKLVHRGSIGGFEKIEQFLFTKPEDSWKAFDDMIAVSEEFYQSLQLPYQVVSIVSGALNNAAAKKYDLEGEYKELVSCSNCTDYQSRELNIRYGAKSQTDSRKKHPHALNATLCATERALCCVLENYQEAEGVRVPNVLRKYIPGAPEFIPYTKELPKDSTSQKLRGKGDGGAKQKVEAAINQAADKLAALK